MRAARCVGEMIILLNPFPFGLAEKRPRMVNFTLLTGAEEIEDEARSVVGR